LILRWWRIDYSRKEDRTCIVAVSEMLTLMMGRSVKMTTMKMVKSSD
jgi:hypothetical protein